MADGTSKPIAEIKAGDKVLAIDPETGEQGARTVTRVIVHNDRLLDLTVDHDAVTTTEDRPFWNDTDQQWQPAATLTPADRLLRPDHNHATTHGLRQGPTRPAPAYNLTNRWRRRCW